MKNSLAFCCAVLLALVVVCLGCASEPTPREEAQRALVKGWNGQFPADNAAKGWVYSPEVYERVRHADGQLEIDKARAGQISAEAERIKAQAASIAAADNRADKELDQRQAIINKTLELVEKMVIANDLDGAEQLLRTLGMGGSQKADRPKMHHGVIINDYPAKLKVIIRQEGASVASVEVDANAKLAFALLPGAYELEAQDARTGENTHRRLKFCINEQRGEYLIESQRYDFIISLGVNSPQS